MGMSTDAYLFYGVTFDNDEGEPIWKVPDGIENELDSEHDWETILDAKLGTLGKSYAERSSARAELGVEIVPHCSASYPMYAVAISETYVRTWRGSPTQVSTQVPDRSWNDKLLKFCELMGIDLLAASAPAWWLASDCDL